MCSSSFKHGMTTSTGTFECWKATLWIVIVFPQIARSVAKVDHGQRRHSEGFRAIQVVHVTLPETICIIKACIMIDISIS
jgi:hypothetical protein